MIQERAEVISLAFDSADVAKKIARVKVIRSSACESCQLKSGCGQKAMTKLSDTKCLELDIETQLSLEVGDEVMIAIPEHGLTNASMSIYLIPLLLMIVGASLGDNFDASELIHSEKWTLLGTLIGLVSGFTLARLYGKRHQFDPAFAPQITKRILPLSSDV